MSKSLEILMDQARREPAIVVAIIWLAASIGGLGHWSVALTVLLVTIFMAAKEERYGPAYGLFAGIAALYAVVRLGLLA